MTLTEIEYGSLASSAILNGNFNYLQEKITELSALITSETSSYSSTVATLNKSINGLLDLRESFIPTGTIIISQANEMPSGFLLCDGSELKIEEYQSLYDVIGTTYGQSDSTTFCIPDLKNKTVWGISSSTKLGAMIEAGLPDIVGHFTASGAYGGSCDGAFFNWGSSSCNQNYGGSGTGWGFEASRSNPIYGKSMTVQPPAIVTNFLIKY